MMGFVFELRSRRPGGGGGGGIMWHVFDPTVLSGYGLGIHLGLGLDNAS